jgi:hypothetical protein
MALTRQYTYTSYELEPIFSDMYDKRLMRLGLQSDCRPQDWTVQGFIDGPLTFVVLTHSTGVEFTGWSKFDYEGQWVEKTGLCKAMGRAIEKYVEYLHWLDQATEAAEDNAIRLESGTGSNS